MKTPHLDMLAREGTRFSACITPNLVCQPSRASILTGLLPRTHGVSDNGIDLPDATGEAAMPAAFQARLSRPAYRQGALQDGAHVRADRHARMPRRARSYGPDWNGPYMGFEHVELMVEGHNSFPPMAPPRGQHYERWYYADGRGEALTGC